MNNIGRILAFSAGFFVGGVVTGLLISPKSGRENRKDVTEKSKFAGDWIEAKSQELKSQASKTVDNMKDKLPDLYKATENFGLSDDEVIS